MTAKHRSKNKQRMKKEFRRHSAPRPPGPPPPRPLTNSRCYQIFLPVPCPIFLLTLFLSRGFRGAYHQPSLAYSFISTLVETWRTVELKIYSGNLWYANGGRGCDSTKGRVSSRGRDTSADLIRAGDVVSQRSCENKVECLKPTPR